MRNIILQEWLTIDGYAAGPNNELDFFESPELNKYSDRDLLDFMNGIDTILLGANTYRLFVDFWPTATTDKEIIADKLNATLKIVFSKTLMQAPWGKWEDAIIVKEDASKRRRSQTPQQFETAIGKRHGTMGKPFACTIINERESD